MLTSSLLAFVLSKNSLPILGEYALGCFLNKILSTHLYQTTLRISTSLSKHSIGASWGLLCLTLLENSKQCLPELDAVSIARYPIYETMTNVVVM